MALELTKPDVAALLASDLETEDIIERLAGMATEGNLDPWDLDIMSIYDRFMSLMTEKRRLNLRISGRSIYYAAVLLRLKAEALHWQEPEEPPVEEWNGYAHLQEPPGLPRNRFIRRAPRPVLLEELAQALRDAEAIYKRRLERRVERPVLPEEVLKFHEEDIEDRIRIVSELLEKMFRRSKTVCLDDLLDALGTDRKTVVFTYMALLFLAGRAMVASSEAIAASEESGASGEETIQRVAGVPIVLTQEEFFGTLLVTRR